MTRSKSLAALLVLAAPLGACASGPAGPLTATNNPSLSSVHQPVVQRTDFVLDLEAAGDSLSQEEQARLIAWFESIELRYGDQIFVEEPRDYGSPGARAAVASVLGEYGMGLREGSPVTQGNVGTGRVRVIASRATASVPGCPNWDDPLYPSVSTSANYGCAVNQNIASMVADPNDLVRGRSGGVSGSGSTAERAVRAFRGRAPTGNQGLGSTATSGR